MMSRQSCGLFGVLTRKSVLSGRDRGAQVESLFNMLNVVR